MKGYGFIVVLLLLLPGALAAELTGTIYDANLNRAENILITVDTTPQQRMLSVDGTYAFTLPQGSYAITASYGDGRDNYTTTEHITISQDGRFVFDLFLFPELDSPPIQDIDDPLLEDELLEAEYADEPAHAADVFTRLFIVLIVIGFGVAVWRFFQRQITDDVDDFSQQVLAFIDAEGGRTTQKELRKHFPHSEAKMSLVVTELESAGKLQKIKRGRGNILVRKK